MKPTDCRFFLILLFWVKARNVTLTQIFDGSEVEINFAISTSLSIIDGVLHRACSACHEPKPTTPEYFPRDKNDRVKIGNTCHGCALARTQTYKANKPVEYLKTITRCMKVWTKNNPDRVQAYSAARLSRERAGGDKLSKHDKEILVVIADGRCQCCGKHLDKPVFDHIVPLVQGGGNGIGNRQVLCRHCNCTKHVKSNDYRRFGLYDLAVAA